MRDLSLHLLDLAQNSITAGASLVTIRLILQEDGWLHFDLLDNGRGMDQELLARVISPFSTTRTTRKVGLGIPMMMENARLTGGDLQIESVPGQGTGLHATMDTGHIDCLPLGDIPGTLLTLIMAHPLTPDFLFEGKSPLGEASFDTREIRAVLGDVPLNKPDVVQWMKDTLEEQILPIFNPILGGMNG